MDASAFERCEWRPPTKKKTEEKKPCQKPRDSKATTPKNINAKQND
jgi:hypothetical protein